MAPETVRCRRARADHGRGHVPALARNVAHRRVVSQHGHVGPARFVLRHGDFPSNLVLRHRLHRQARFMAVSELV